MTTEFLLDISRLLSRIGRPVPTGIDRVELAYAEFLLRSAPERLAFGTVAAGRGFAILPASLGRRLVETLGARWSGRPDMASARRLALEARLALLAPRRLRRPLGPRLYLLLSHHHLDRTALIGRIKARAQARFCCLVHDLIPITLPEYAKPNQTQRHLRRMQTVAALADGVIVNSDSTGQAVAEYLGPDHPPIHAAPLGIEVPPADPRPNAPAIERPYFVVVGTIEAKKNHLMLLNVWRRLAQTHPEEIPRLVIVGQRGWMVTAVTDMLERSPSIRAHVWEYNSLSDRAVDPLVRSARALLMPSFAEGFGLPVAEALARGVPVLCSDLPALRYAGGDAPEYLDPLDGPSWAAAILDYAKPNSPRRAAQLARIERYVPPSWERHFAQVMPFLDRIAEGRPARPPRTCA